MLLIRVVPRGKRDEIAGLRDGRLLVRTTAPPAEGAANERVLEFLAKALSVRRKDLDIVSGERARDKRILVRGLAAEEVTARVQERLQRAGAAGTKGV
jgi:hypothetical protein